MILPGRNCGRDARPELDAHSRKTDVHGEGARQQAPVTVIDMRAGILSATIRALADLGFLRMVREGKIRIVVLHVIGSTVASLQEIAATAGALANARHVLVANHTNDASFFAGIEGVQRDALAAAINLPKLTERATEFVEAASLPFSDFAKDENQSLTMRGYVGNWLERVFAQFDAAKLDVRD
jgi:hypothetical protein